MKKITIIATGSRGDVQPYIALGKGLSEAGYEVRFLTHQNFEPLVTGQDLDFRPVRGDVQAISQNDAMRERLEKGNFLSIMAQMAREAERGAVDLAEAGLDACRDADLLLGGLGGLYPGVALAEKFDIPFVQAHVLPFTPTGDFPGVLAPGLPRWTGTAARRFSHHVVRQILWQGFRSADGKSRRMVLGLPAAPFFGPYRSPHLDGMPVLYGLSPAFLSKPKDWASDVHLTGYWFLPAEPDWLPPAGLEQFLDDGPPPVYIGFGSMSHRHPEQTAKVVVDAVQQAGLRAVLLSGWGGLRPETLPASIFVVDSIPHDWLFPRVSAVVHHGGAGTTAAGLRAGVPTVVVPFFGDQPFWGRQIAAAGVGTSPIPRRLLSADRLAAALREATANDQMREKAAHLGAGIREEDGVGRAVEIINDI